MDTNASQTNFNTYGRSAQRHYEKLAFVEHICGVMIEDRFDNDEPPRPWQVFNGDVESMFSKTEVFELMPDWAFEFMPGEFEFSRFVSPGSARPGADITEIIDPIHQSEIVVNEFLSCGMMSLSPATLGRGSPITVWTQPLAAVPRRSAVRLA